MLTMAVIGTCTGKLPGRFGDLALRSTNPTQYWSTLLAYYLCGVGFIAYFLYTIHAFTN
jgi:hypothetical protein